MADNESLLEAGRRLARDLRSIRRSRSIDVKVVLDATRLADDVIEQLEETALMGNPMFNRVYLRSMFSSYASVVGIKPAEMMSALEEAMSGKYDGSLAAIYLGKDHVREDGEDGEEEEDEEDKEEGQAVVEIDQDVPATKVGGTADESGLDTTSPERSLNKEKKGEDSAGGKPEAGLQMTKTGLEKPDTDPQKSTTDSTKAGPPKPSAKNSSAKPPTDQSIKPPGQGKAQSKPERSSDKVDSSELAADTKKKEVQKIVASPEPILGNVKGKKAPAARTVLLPNMSGFLILVFAGIALVSLLWFAVSWVLSPKAEPEETVVAQDTTAIDSRVMPNRVVLGDTIKIDLIAYTEALDPIRVKLDKDLRKPYWIEHTDTLYFQMVDRVDFEREVDHARILIDGFAVPTRWYASSVGAEITREKTQAWLDSLTSSGTFPPRSIAPASIVPE